MREAVERAARLLQEPASELPFSMSPSAVLCVRPIRSDEVLNWRAHMERFHYLGDVALIGESLRYAADLDGKWVALLSWSSASLHNAPRDRYVGWDEVRKKERLSWVVNNARFLMLPWVRYPHLASRVLGANLRRLRRDWEERYGHPVVLAETFVDLSRFRGTCYRASNWIFVGTTQGWAKSGGLYRFHGQPKSVWLYPLCRSVSERLCAPTEATNRKEAWVTIEVEKLPLEGEGGLFDVLSGMIDPRKTRGIRHKIQSVLTIAICATLSGARSITAMAEWAAEQSYETLKKLGSRRGKPPSERTFRRVFDKINVEEVDRRTGSWVAEQYRLQAGDAVAIDGKTVRGSRDGDKSPIHLLSAIVHGRGTVIAQVAVDCKTNEITRVGALFKDVDLREAVVTSDALLTQDKIAHHLVKEKGADYVFTVKDNQPTLRQDIQDLQMEAFPPSAHHDG
jgi:hypothetical protein